MFRKDKAFLKDPIFPHCILPIIVLVLLVAVFCLPDNLKEQYALRGDLEYAHSHCITLIKMGAQKAQSFSFGMNGQGLDSSASKKSWGCSLAEGSPDMRCRQGVQAE